jgi:hypothetical protein
MTQSHLSLNPWLTSYILQYAAVKSRYEIDKYLIEAGCEPTEIELAWQQQLSPKMETKSFKTKLQSKFTLLFISYQIFGLVFLLVFLFGWIVIPGWAFSLIALSWGMLLVLMRNK